METMEIVEPTTVLENDKKVILESNHHDKKAILADKSKNAEMIPTQTLTIIDGITVELLYNQNILLQNRNGGFEVRFGPEVFNWIFFFIFEEADIAIPNRRAMTSNVEIVDGGNTIIIRYYSWYGSDLETNRYHTIESTDGQTQIYIKMRTTASRSIDTRSAHVSIWRAAN